MATTSHMGITLVEQAQAQKEVTVNAALSRIDAVLNTGAIDKDLATPPGSPAAGDVYIVAASPTGVWTGHAKHVAYFDQAWCFIPPTEGLTLWVRDEDRLYTYDGTNWGTSVLPYADGAEADITSTITWTGGGDPAGTAVKRYSWYRVGKMVFVQMRGEYATAGTSNTLVTINFPADLPAPVDFSGVGDGETCVAACGYFSTSPTSNPASSRAWVDVASGVHRVNIVAAATAVRLFVVSFQYKTS